ncbi:MAG: MmgE/PrpD family protein, partial [Rhodospirillales bacterium]|nr:MmgE/PrpD family protein [Rhodospirillales bacterium]
MLLQRIADYAVSERATMLPDGVVHHAKRALLDWFAALLPGTREAAAAILRESLADELGTGDAEIYGLGRRGPLRAAALVNGVTSHIVEFDDIFRDGLYHPGCPTVAAALAAAQAKGASGERLLRAIVVGYEISTRIAVAVVPAHYRYWHTTGTVGTFGAAAAVSTVLGLDQSQMAHALATAATMAAGLQQAFRSDAMSKPLHAGHAAEAGALAAMLAAKGFTGALDVLEGEAGFGAARGGAPAGAPAPARGGGRGH